MLNNDPEKRPTAMEVYNSLRGNEVATDSGSDTIHRENNNTVRKAPESKEKVNPSSENSTTKENPFFRPGDL